MFFSSLAVILAFLIAGSVFTGGLSAAGEAVLGWTNRYLGWFSIVSTTFILGFAAWLMCGRFGRVRLGPDTSRPEFGTWSWFAMLFTAGMGIGLVYYGVYEPVYLTANPGYGGVGADPAGDPPPLSEQAAAEAMNATFFHWGLHPWAIYSVLGAALGYLCFRKGLPLRPASALYPLIGNRVHGWAGSLVDVLAVFCTVFGLATSLGIGTRQINAGLALLYGLPNEWWSQLAIVAAITAVAVTSLMLGLNRGIRPLSVAAMALAAVLLTLVFASGPTLYVLTRLIDSTGHYLQHLPETSLAVADPATDGAGFGYQSLWTLFYWGWWISWSPFVGMFMARVSYGRTIREFIAGAMLAPAGVSVAWFGVFGWAGIYYDSREGAGISAESADHAVFALLESLPIGGGVLYTLVALLVLAAVVLFFATSSDSGSLVVDMLTNGSDPHPVKAQRLLWALIQGLVAAVLIVSGVAGPAGVADPILTLQLVATGVTGLPFAVVLVLVCVGLARALRSEDVDPPAPRGPGAAAAGGPEALADDPAEPEGPPPGGHRRRAPGGSGAP
ncbi:BCCT family transporter [Nocardiopsis mangrovi]|uniref:BCCT family transporter n=1 Tax=Nocardiopsis mangrovi TaxID=1179818 RepID=A0ABV9E2M3_9ACTN